MNKNVPLLCGPMVNPLVIHQNKAPHGDHKVTVTKIETKLIKCEMCSHTLRGRSTITWEGHDCRRGVAKMTTTALIRVIES